MPGITMRLFILLCTFFLCMNTIAAYPLEQATPEFNIKQANQRFDQINLQLSTQNLNQDDLNTAIDTLSTYSEQAEQCINDAQKKVNNLTALIHQSSNTVDKNMNGADLVYLSREKTNMSNRLAQCRLFSIRAKDAIEAYKIAYARLTQKETLTRRLPLWNVIHSLIASPPFNDIDALLKLQPPPALQSTTLWIIFSCLALILSSVLLIKIRNTRFAKDNLHIKQLYVRHILLLSLCLLAGALFFYLFILAHDEPSTLLELSQQLFIYLTASIVIVSLANIKRIKTLCVSYSIDRTFCQASILVFLSFYTLSSLAQTLADAIDFNPLLIQLTQSLFLLTMLITGIGFVYYFCHTHMIKRHKKIIQQLGILILMSCAAVTILGYHTLAIRIASSALTSALILFITFISMRTINKIYLKLNHETALQERITIYFGYKKGQLFTEFLILKTTTQVIIIALSVFLILRSWGFASYYLERIYSQFLYGVHFANTTIYPIRIVLGLIVYCLLYLLFRGISTAISRRQQFDGEEETQVAIASIFTYIGFTLAFISALLVAGFNFTGLAIIAGALSVGIGLGLQSIVNNFVSGLILLIEKPFRTGDRINVDNIEGFVKKIRVRSTHLITPTYEDIIIPNSDLITKRVTNYVYSNKHISINCDINVPVGSDVTLVRHLLLDAAQSHDDVIKTGRNKPYVLFRSFNEKTLSFQLWCLIKDVNIKLMVISDLNFAIDQRLRANKIG